MQSTPCSAGHFQGARAAATAATGEGGGGEGDGGGGEGDGGGGLGEGGGGRGGCGGGGEDGFGVVAVGGVTGVSPDVGCGCCRMTGQTRFQNTKDRS